LSLELLVWFSRHHKGRRFGFVLGGWMGGDSELPGFLLMADASSSAAELVSIIRTSCI
jgi:hypothetical protein